MLKGLYYIQLCNSFFAIVAYNVSTVLSCDNIATFLLAILDVICVCVMQFLY